MSAAVLLILIYILIGALIWAALGGAGSASQHATTRGRAVTASAMMIAGWPLKLRLIRRKIFTPRED